MRADRGGSDGGTSMRDAWPLGILLATAAVGVALALRTTKRTQAQGLSGSFVVRVVR